MTTIEYWKPVGSAWHRMVEILFRPFNMEKWFIIGFAAWIAGANLGGGGGNSGGSGNSCSSSDSTCTSGDWSFPEFWAEYGHIVLPAAAVGIILLIALIVAFSWLQARGSFIFLDNVIHNRGAIVEPWKKYRAQGNSLFQWNLAVGAIGLAILLLLAGICLLMVWPMFTDKINIPMGVGGIVLGISALLLYSFTFGYLAIFVHDFIVPLMLKHDLRIRGAWSLFGPLLKQNFGKFFLYGLVRYVVLMVVNMGYFAICLATCCCFLILTFIPYIGTVLLLPAHVFMRLIGPEFLSQFGKEFTATAPPADENIVLTVPPPTPEPEVV